MRVLRALSLLVATAAVAGLVLGSFGFTAMGADRGVGVDVVGDDTAYLGFAQINDAVESGEERAIVEYENRFGTNLTTFDAADVVIVDGADTTAIATVEGPSSLPADATRTVGVTLTCDAEETVELAFSADGSGSGVGVSMTRVREVTCTPGFGIERVKYNGVGNAKVNPDGPDDTVEAVVWLTEANPGSGGPDDGIEREQIDLDTSSPVQKQLPKGKDRSRNIAAIGFPNHDVAYFHPGWDAGTHDDPSAGDGVAFADEAVLPLDSSTVANATVEDDEVRIEDGSDGPSENVVNLDAADLGHAASGTTRRVANADRVA